jgi:hypothetical protein
LVTGAKNDALRYSGRNIPGVKTITAPYLNPEDVLNARQIIFVADALKVAEETFATDKPSAPRIQPPVAKVAKKPVAVKKAKPQAKSSTKS